ncbi:hypothetical protein [Bacillus safensis]|uniref:hypothetical protein n=1 Tax=Bacillus safensis TaxID=561879 RepID=UPI003D081913
MGNEIIIAIIGGVVTILVGLITALASYKGAISGAKIQIQKNEEELEQKRIKEREEREKKEKKDLEYRAEIIENFIDHEIKDNFKAIRTKAFEENFLESSLSQDGSYIYFNYNFLRFSEFEKAKYELIKSKSERISEVLTIYDAFKNMVSCKGDIKKLSNGEYKKLKEGYRLCLQRFNE